MRMCTSRSSSNMYIACLVRVPPLRWAFRMRVRFPLITTNDTQFEPICQSSHNRSKGYTICRGVHEHQRDAHQTLSPLIVVYNMRTQGLTLCVFASFLCGLRVTVSVSMCVCYTICMFACMRHCRLAYWESLCLRNRLRSFQADISYSTLFWCDERAYSNTPRIVNVWPWWFCVSKGIHFGCTRCIVCYHCDCY